MVAWMCHEECTVCVPSSKVMNYWSLTQDTGLVIEAMGGWAGRHQNWRGKGVALLDRVGGQVAVNHKISLSVSQVTPEMVATRWEEITSMEEAEAHESHQEATGLVMARITDTLNEEQEAGGEKGVKDAIGYESKPYNFRYSFR